MFVIGIDPHRGSHTAAVLDGTEELLDEYRVVADRCQRQRLLEWAAPFTPRVWAVEGATGTGALLAQQLAAAGEAVVDVPPKLSARVRLLDSGRSDKTDSHDARAAAVVALRHRSLRPVGVEDHVAVLRLLAKRHHDLVAARTRAVCRLHTTLCHLAEGHFPKRMKAAQAAAILARLRPGDPVSVERKSLARELLAEIRRLDRDLAAIGARITTTVTASGTSVADVFGVGPVVAAYLIGYSGDIARFPGAGHYARYNGTAPIEASSGPTKRHRLNPRGNRQLNHALHVAAVTQVRNDTPGRAYYLRKEAEGEVEEGRTTRAQAARLRRRVPRTPRPQAHLTSGPGRTSGNDSNGLRDRLCTLTAGSSVKSLPDPPRPYDHRPRACFSAPINQPLDTNRLRTECTPPPRRRHRTP